MRLILGLVLGWLMLTGSTLRAQPVDNLEELRNTFLDGQRAASRDQLLLARQHLQHLRQSGYILAPYLELSILLSDLHDVDESQVLEFMDSYEGTWLGEKLRLNWLIVLRSNRDYQRYVDFFVEGTGNASQECFYYESLYRLGQQQRAFEGARQLWLVAESQSSGCDWLFARWRSSDVYNDEYLWQRFILARRAGETSLARYLESIVHDPAVQVRMQAYHRIRSEPEILQNTRAFIEGGSGYSEVIAQGLRNLAADDLELALELWPQYQESGVMTPDDQAYALSELLERLRDQQENQAALELAARHGSLLSEEIISDNLVAAARGGDWSLALDWLDLVPEGETEEDKWLYWRARAMNALGQPANDIYQRLSMERSYYGFLSSLQTRGSFNLNDRSSPAQPDWQPEPRVSAALRRAIELEAVGYTVNGRLSWQHATRLLSENETVQAAWWARSSGFHFLAIQATIQSGSWDELDIRFPLAFYEEFSRSADQAQMPLPWLFAISRQESAFAADVRSPAGAMGLMQLMPGTARQMARRAEMSYDGQRLVDPEYNIRLGTSYLAMAYEEFDRNPVLATAAYNAGIARVKSWLREHDEPLALDIWIESIPFYETRNYVKNVLAYSVIYGAKLGQPSLIELLDSQLFNPPTRAG